MEVKIVNNSGHPLPEYSTEFSAGMDLRASLKKNAVLRPFERTLIPTGIKIELPRGCEAQIRPRSGLAKEEGITVLNAPGTIDADYRGEVKVLLINMSHEIREIGDGDRIAQMIVASYEKVEWKKTGKLNTSVRGEGGYGHTGKT